MLEGRPEEFTIRIAPINPGWPGRWWGASFQGLNIARSRDPARAVARLLLRTRHAAPQDVLVITLDGREIAREEVGSAARRMQQKTILEMFWRQPEKRGRVR